MSLNPRFQPMTTPYQSQQHSMRAEWSSNVRKEILLKQDVACKWSRGTFNAFLKSNKQMFMILFNVFLDSWGALS